MGRPDIIPPTPAYPESEQQPIENSLSNELGALSDDSLRALMIDNQAKLGSVNSALLDASEQYALITRLVNGLTGDRDELLENQDIIAQELERREAQRQR